MLVLTSGDHAYMDDARLEELRSWLRRGGTLVATRSAAAWAACNGLTPHISPPGGDDEDRAEERRDYEDAPEIEGAREIGGSIWATDLDTTHPLGFGYTRRFLPVWRDHSLFFEPSENRYNTVAQLTDDPHLSGYVSAENEERLRNSPSVMADNLERGSVVLLIDNPNFRGYWRGTTRLFLNALFFGNHIDVP